MTYAHNRLRGNPTGCNFHAWTETTAARRYWTAQLRIGAHDFVLSVRIA